MGIIRILVWVALALFSFVSILANFRKPGKENVFNPKSLTATGKILFLIGVPLFIAAIIFQSKDFNDNNLLSAQLIANHNTDSLQRLLDKRETIDTVNKSLAKINLTLDKNYKVVSVVNNVTNNYNGTIKPRHLTSKDLSNILKEIPNKDYMIRLMQVGASPDLQRYCEEIDSMLVKRGYKYILSGSMPYADYGYGKTMADTIVCVNLGTGFSYSFSGVNHIGGLIELRVFPAIMTP